MPTRGECYAALVFHIGEGRYDRVPLDDLSVVVLLHTPGRMDEGNWTVGLIVDARATAEQQEALTAIASGAAGGPMAALAPLIKDFKGVERAPIRIERRGMSHAVSIPGLLDEALEGVPSPIAADQPL
jgi:hypothetical protein